MGAGADWSNRFASAPIDAMQVYDDIFVSGMFIPWAKVLLDEVELEDGEAVLDVACGPGTVTRLAAARVGATGRVVGADISPAMLAIASAKPTPSGARIEYIETPAAPLAVGDGEFDVILCQQGFQFFPDRPAAAREMRRALKPGGRVALAVWSAIEDQPMFAGLASAVGEVMGPDTAARYANGPWGHSLDALEADVTAAGLTTSHAQTHTLDVVFDCDGARFSDTLRAAGIADEVAALSGDDRRRLVEAAGRILAPLVTNGKLRSPSATHIVVGRA